MFCFSGKFHSCSKAAQRRMPVGSVHATSLGAHFPALAWGTLPSSALQPPKVAGSQGRCLARVTCTHGMWRRLGACQALDVSAGATAQGSTGAGGLQQAFARVCSTFGSSVPCHHSIQSGSFARSSHLHQCGAGQSHSVPFPVVLAVSSIHCLGG